MASQKIRKSTLLGSLSHFMLTQGKQIVTILCVVAVLIGFFFAHRVWVAKRERSAQYDFSTLIAEYDVMSQEKNPQWQALLDKFEAQYAQHASSSLLPYYQNYKVHILLQQGDRDAALATLDTMVDRMQFSPIVELYAMERALIQIDSADEVIVNTGLEALKNLAYDESNIYRDSAQFYLGRFYWANDQIDDARMVWQQLVDEQQDEKIAPSPWAGQVQELLKLTIV